MKGWLDNFGKAENANDSNVSFSEGFVGLGYNTKGRNYSPAWGGQFQGGGKLIPVSPMEQITGQAPSVISPTVPYLQTKDPVEFYQSWIQSPEYARRQLLTGYSPSAKDESLAVPSASASRQTRLESLQNIDPITYSTRQASEARPGVYGIASTVNINPLDYIDTNRGMVEAHELAHIAGAMESEGTTRPGVMSAREQEIFKKSMLPMKEPVLSGPQGSQQREASKRALEDFMHSQKPKELKADLDALRFTMYDKGIYDITKGQKFTESDFEKAKQNLGKDRVFKRLENRVGKKNFVNLMNTIAKADEEELPMAMGGMSIPGSVGFTYARTAGSAPSKGKYAKKTMASAQKGKNDIEKISINDPRYPEMYKNRQVGLSYDDAISLPDLPEVVITAPRSYTMDSLRDFTTAALYGSPANAMKLSIIPQAAMTEGIEVLRGKPYDFSNVNPNIGYFTSNQRDLSKTMGYEKPEGFLQNAANIGLSAIDPLLVTGLASALRKPLQKGAQQFGKYLTDETFLKNTYRYNPLAFKANPEAYYHRSPNLENIINRETGILQGFGQSKAGKEFTEQALKPSQGLKLTKGANSQLYFSKGVPLDFGRTNMLLDEKTGKLIPGQGYKGPYLVEVKNVPMGASTKGRAPGAEPTKIGSYAVSKRPIAVDESKFYKEDWLKGYKEISKPKEYGGEIPSAQNGQEMKFYQNGLDWKPKSMQEGGKIYEGQELPEFVVEGKDDRLKQAMYEGSGKFYQGLGGVMGSPQTGLMEVITGKQQTPSEAWGFDTEELSWYNPKSVSNFAMDFALDPMNLLGTGIVDDLTRGAIRGAAQDAVSKTLKYGISPYSYSPEVLARIPENLTRAALGKPKSLPKAVTEVTEKNPQAKRTVEDTYNNREDAWSVYLGLPPENKGLKLVGSDEATGLSKYELTKPRVMSPADVKDYKKVIDRSTFKTAPKQYLNLNKPGDTVVDSDKLFGVMAGYSKFISPDGKSIMYRDVWDVQPFSRFTPEELPTKLGEAVRNFEVSSLIPGAKPFVSEGKLADIKTKYYPAKPYKDIKSRFNEQLGYVSNYYEPEAFIKDIDNPTAEEIFNYDQMLRDVAKKSLMQRIKNEKTFLNPLSGQDSRKYADFAPYIKVDKSKKKDGGIVKDNEGYWNPDNWGQPVEIDSNMITMQGVYEPLLGVSDTGDTKLMKPGKNYKFKGKKVTEYPVAKLGINQLDAQPMKKLNQLLNFTNNPDKDNWLDKYN